MGKAPEQLTVVKNNKPAPVGGWGALFNSINLLLKENNKSCDTNSFALFEIELDTNGKVIFVDAIWEVLKCGKGRNVVFEILTNTTWDVSHWDFRNNPKCKVLVPADLHYTDINIIRRATHPLGMQKFYAKIGQGRWIPGKQGGSFVKMQLKLPIRLEAN